MSSPYRFKYDELKEFLNLTSDERIRSAAWPKDQWNEAGGDFLLGYGQVTSQDAPPEIVKHPPPRGLLSFGPEQNTEIINQPKDQRAANIKAHKKLVFAHPIYKKWLASSDYFRDAKAKFGETCASAKAGPLTSEFAEYRFLYIVAFHLGVYLLTDRRGAKIKRPNSKELDKATSVRLKCEQIQLVIGNGLN